MYILLGQVQHLLESTPRGTEEQEIISIPYTDSTVVTDEATTLVLLESVHIKIKEELFRLLLLPSDICCLFPIDEYQHPDDDIWDFGS